MAEHWLVDYYRSALDMTAGSVCSGLSQLKRHRNGEVNHLALDHGMLNVPLDKRDNFHKELDDHLAAEKRKKHDELFSRKTAFNDAKSQAQHLYLKLDIDLVRAEAKRRGMKITEFREVLKDIRDFKPKQAPVAFAPFIKAA